MDADCDVGTIDKKWWKRMSTRRGAPFLAAGICIILSLGAYWAAEISEHDRIASDFGRAVATCYGDFRREVETRLRGVEERPGRVRSTVAPSGWEELVERALSRSDCGGISMSVYAGPTPDEATLLYPGRVGSGNGEGAAGSGGKGPSREFEATRVLDTAGGKQLVLLKAKPDFLASRKTFRPVLILAGTLVLTFLLALCVITGIRHTLNIDELVRVWTEEKAERAGAETALRESEERYRLLADSSREVIWAVDLSGKLTYLSPSLILLTGYTPEESMEIPMEESMTPASADVMMNKVRQVAEDASKGIDTETGSIEIELVRKDGSTVWVEVTADAMFDRSGILTGVRGTSRDITERRRSEEAIRDRERELEAIYDNAPLIMLLVDRDRRILKANKLAETFTLHPASGMEGKKAGEGIRCIHAHDDPQGCGFGPSCLLCPIRKAVSETCETGRGYRQVEVTLTFTRGDRVIEATALLSTVRIPIKGEMRVLATLQDISERKLAEKKLEKVNARLESIIEFLPDATFVLDKEGKVTAWNRAIEEMTGVPKKDIIGRDHFDAAVPFYGVRRPFLIDLVSRDQEEIALKYNYVKRSGNVLYAEAFTPALYGGEGAHVWATASPLLDEAGELTGAIESIRDITGRKKAEEEARESEKRYRELADQLPETVAEIDLSGAFTFVNTGGLEKYGYIKDDLDRGLTLFDLLVPEDRDRARERLSNPGETQESEYRLVKKDGTKVTVLVYTAQIVREGKPAGIRAIAVDLTERKEAEEALKRAEEKYRSIFENSVEGIFQTTADGRYLSANPSLAAMYGYDSPEDLIRSVADIETQQYVRPSDRKALKDLYDRQGFVEAFETELYRKDGARVWISMNARAVRGPDGTTAYYEGTAEDITARKQAEEAVKESEKRYRELADQLPETIAEFDARGRFTFVNLNGFETFGYTWKDVEEGVTVVQMVVPEEHAKLRENMAGLLRGEGTGGGEYTMITKTGVTFPALVRSAVTLLNDGKPGFRSVIMDITERKRAEEALRESEEKFRTLFENANDAILLLKDGRIVDCNPRTMQMFRCARRQILGKVPYGLSPHLQPDESDSKEKGLEKGWGAFTGTPQFFEWRHRRYDGTLFDAEVSLNRIVLGGEVFIQVIERDVTQRKQIEEKLRTMSIMDELTGLYNRRGFLALCQQQLSFAERTMKGAALFFMDLDRMKWINDTLGHREGDAALVEIASILRDSFRRSDIVGRMGGDEFAVLAIDAGNEESEALKRLRNSLDRRNEDPAQSYKLSVSVGIAYFNPENPASLDDLMACADDMMYKDKRERYSEEDSRRTPPSPGGQ